MPLIPRKRLVLYLLAIVLLGYALAAASFRTSSPRLPSAGDVVGQDSVSQLDPADQLPERGEPTGQKSRTAKGPKEAKDELLALNALSSEDEPAQPDDGLKASAATPAPPTPAVPTATPDSGMIGGARDDDDARDAFSQLSQDEPFGTGDQFIGGGRSSAGGIAGLPPAQQQPGGSSGGAWVSGQARGYAMLYAMQPQARAVVESNVATLLSAQVREPYIGVLIDGTFGLDLEYLKSIIARLSVDRNLTLELYLTNGATQRNYEGTPIRAPFVNLNPAVFRAKIKFDPAMQGEFSAIAARARDIFEFSAQRNSGNQHLVTVMLEDNLDVSAYRKMRELAAQQLDGSATFIRSPCPSCIAGDRESDADTAGDAREEHGRALFGELRRGDGFTLDGTGFRYPGDSSTLGISPDEIKALITAGNDKGLRYFGLWRHAWQGAKQNSRDNPHPDRRTYVASLPEQEAFEIELLRLGLAAEPTEDSEESTLLMGTNP